MKTKVSGTGATLMKQRALELELYHINDSFAALK